MSVFYNDNDIKMMRWIKELMSAGHIPIGETHRRDIVRLESRRLQSHSQVHLFAGIGGWAYALRLAGWSEDRPVWTGSCPCQPFSVAGNRKGTADARHLWPQMFRLVKECHPPTIFGEQVASADGRQWLAGVFADLETLGYAVAGADLCAAGIGAPHIRQRLFWVANTASNGRKKNGSVRFGEIAQVVGRSEWNSWDSIICGDNKRRRKGSGMPCVLDDGVSVCMDYLRGFGNAIVPQVAARFIRAFMETE